MNFGNPTSEKNNELKTFVDFLIFGTDHSCPLLDFLGHFLF